MSTSGDMVRRAKEGKGAASAQPAMREAIVTCMDVRLEPLAIAGLVAGDAHVLRNAGGIVTDDVIRSLLLSQLKLGTRHVSVIMHTDCGVHNLDEGAVIHEVVGISGSAPPFSLLGFADLRERLARSVEAIRKSKLLPHPAASGAIFDVDTRTLQHVIPDGQPI